MDKPGDQNLTTEQKAAAFSTWRHINRVQYYLGKVQRQLIGRMIDHDQSKLETPEAEDFAIVEDIGDSEYQSEAYERNREEVLGDALAHHYANNRHHPEHFKEGVDEMNILDILEMLCDWNAGSERTKSGNIRKSIEENAKRFGLSPQLVRILENSVDILADQ
jgi:hypothetical protein